MSDILKLANSISESKEKIRQAIINKGVAVAENVKLADYADKVGAIRKAADYTVTAVDAVNYTGKNIIKGDKVWIVPQNVTEDGEVKEVLSGTKQSIVNREGTTIYIYDKKYDIATETYSDLPNLDVDMCYLYRWGNKDIYAMSQTTNYSYSCIVSRGDSVYCYLYDDLICWKGGGVWYKDEKIGEIVELVKNFHACFDHTNNWLYVYKYSYNQENYITRYKIDTAAKSVTEDSDFHKSVSADSYRVFLGTTSDGKYLIKGYYLESVGVNNLYIYGINSDGLQDIADLSILCADLADIRNNPDAFIQFNGIDDILLVRYDGFLWVFKYSADKFELISKIADLGYYSNARGYMWCSADGKVICGSYKYMVLKNNSNTFKAINFTGNISSDGYSGIAEGSAESGGKFKVGIVLPPENSTGPITPDV